VDVSCAGDATLAAFTAAFVSKLPATRCAELANLAGALAVERAGASPISLAELELRASTSKIAAKNVPTPALADLVSSLKKCSKRVVFTNGCFDKLHRGHIHHLQEAKNLGDILIVALNSDASVRRIKGEGRPANRLEDRLSILSSLSFVDYLVVFEEDTPINLLQLVRPDILVKGANTLEIVGEEHAGQVVRLPMLEDHSIRVLAEEKLAEEFPLLG
jgi:D-beta-D-heptose 7-phosphate kinase/D-beta-D-heptose 1-phosphate adenosyltransferase